MTTNIKTLTDVEQALSINFTSVREALKAIPAETMSDLDKANMYNQFVWEKIIQAKNNGWRADFLDSSQWKHFPYAWLNKDDSTPSGFGFSHPDTYYAGTGTGVGARLLLEKEKLAKEAIQDFPNEYLAMTLFAKEPLA